MAHRVAPLAPVIGRLSSLVVGSGNSVHDTRVDRIVLTSKDLARLKINGKDAGRLYCMRST